MGTYLQDLRYALRTLQRTPSFSVPVVLSLALAIGSNVAAFSFLNTLTLKPLPVLEPSRLYQVHHAGDAGTSGTANYKWFELVRDQARSTSGVLQVKAGLLKVAVNDQVETLHGQRVTGDYFDVLGVAPLAGRLLTPADQRESGSNRVAVISESFWAGRFARDSGAIGRTVHIDQIPHEIVGVTRNDFFGLEVGRRVDVTIPMDGALYGADEWLEMPLIVRLAPHVTRTAATAELSGFIQQFAEITRLSSRSRDRWFRDVSLQPVAHGLGEMRTQYLEPTVTVATIVGIVLLLACSNWAMLLMARGAARRQDMSIRMALGATRGRLAGQVLLESLLLALAGGALGLFAASWALHLFARVLPERGLPIVFSVTPDLRVLSFTVGVSLLTGLLFGGVPAWLGARIGPGDLRTSRASAQGSRTGNTFVVLQVTLSFLLVVTASLLVATLNNLRNQDTGFEADGVLMLTVDADDTGLEGEQLRLTHRQILDEVRAIPGVESATLATIAPLSGSEDGKPITVPGFTPPVDDQVTQVNTVAPEYFATFGISVLSGRAIVDADHDGAPRVALLSESAARFYFPGIDPIGRQLEIGGATKSQVEIVGVVHDVMHRDFRTPPARMVYVPFFQRYAEGDYALAVRSSGEREDLARWIQQLIDRAAPALTVRGVRPLAQQVDDRLFNERVLAGVSGFFGVLALVLAGLGVLGVISYSVSGRTRELGVRMALGADRSRVLLLFLGQGMRLALLGVTLGVLLTLGVTRALGSFLFGIAPTDFFTLAGAGALLAAVALIASWVPAFRGARVDPTVALQSE